MAYAGLDLTGRKALVTGAARGIGATLAVGLAQAGADVAVCDLASDESWEGLADTVWKIRNEGQVGLAVDLDVQEVEEIRPTIRQVERDLGGLDILVNNAGIRRRAPALEVTEEDWDAVMDTNLKGAFFCAQAAARLMIPQGYGRIINIASQMALVGATNPGGVLREQGRAAESDAGAGAGVGTARSHGERHRAGSDADAGGAGGGDAGCRRSGGRDAGEDAAGSADGSGGTGGGGDLPGERVGGGDDGADAGGGWRLDGDVGPRPCGFRRAFAERIGFTGMQGINGMDRIGWMV